MSAGAIAGIVVGACVGVILIILGIVFLIKRKKPAPVIEPPKEKPKMDDSMLLDFKPSLGHSKVERLAHKSKNAKSTKSEQTFNTEEINTF